MVGVFCFWGQTKAKGTALVWFPSNTKVTLVLFAVFDFSFVCMPEPQSSIPQGLRELQHASIALTNLLFGTLRLNASPLSVSALHALVEMCITRGHMNCLDENLSFERDIFFWLYTHKGLCVYNLDWLVL